LKSTFAKRFQEALNIRDMKPIDVANKTGIGKNSISYYLSGIHKPKSEYLYLIAQVLDVSEAWLMGHDVPMERVTNKYPDNILRIETRKFPLLGTIAAGEPVFADENFESYVEAGADIRADFCLKVQGDSMVNARICNGDIVFIKKQPDVNDGEIAAVLIDDEATLKRVYKKDSEIILIAENPSYKPMVYKGEELNDIRILGKAIAFQSNVI